MECFTPFIVQQRDKGQSIPVPCGKCPACAARRVSQWSFRLTEEEKISSSSLFLTLTYDTSFVPITSRGRMSVNKRDLQLFFKRLRKANKNTRIKYYAAAEYGGKTSRPHYHAILFNADLNTIQPAWPMGQIHYGQVSGASIGYTLKYINKRKRIPMYATDDRVSEFALMSKGLGKSYLTDQMIAWHEADINHRMYVNLPDGRKIGMPRYYKDKIYTEAQREHTGVITRLAMLERLQIKIDRAGPLYYKNLASAHAAAIEKHDLKSLQSDKL